MQLELQQPVWDLLRRADGLSRFMDLDFKYLADDRILARKSKYEGRVVSGQFNEAQDPTEKIFPIEFEKINDLFAVCKEKQMSDGDFIHLIPALHLCFYAHQLQFRESGEPYTVHPMQMAIEAIRDHDADWQTAALCLLHDTKEDSRKYFREVSTDAVEYLYTKLFGGFSKDEQAAAKRDGQFLSRGIDALHKVTKSEAPRPAPALTFSKEQPAQKPEVLVYEHQQRDTTLETVMKQYSIILSDTKKRPEDVRIVLVKLLDRKFNLETIRFMPHEKQIEKAQETFYYIAMAEAFHFYDLADELLRLTLSILDPDLLGSLVEKMKSQKESDEALSGILDLDMWLEKMDRFGVAFFRLKSPTLRDHYNAYMQKDLDDEIKTDLEIVIRDSEIGNTENIQAIGNFVGEQLSMIEATNERPDITLSLHSAKDFMLKNASPMHLIGNKDLLFGTHGDWIKRYKEYLKVLEKRFDRTRKRVRSIKSEADRENIYFQFASTLTAGAKEVRDGRGNRLFLPENATYFDVLFSLYGPDVFRMWDATMSRQKNIYTLNRSDVGTIIPEGVTVRNLHVIQNIPGFENAEVDPNFLQYCGSWGVYRALTRMIAKRVEEENSETFDEDLIRCGKSKISRDYSEAWNKKKMENYLAPSFSTKKIASLPASFFSRFQQTEFSTFDEFARAVATGKVPLSTYRRYLKELVEYRDNFVYVSIFIRDKEDTEKINFILNKLGISPEKMRVIQLDGGDQNKFDMLFSETQMSDSNVHDIPLETQMQSKFSQLVQELGSVGTIANCHWNKLKIIRSKIPMPTPVSNTIGVVY